jgi:hypothetical protein
MIVHFLNFLKNNKKRFNLDILKLIFDATAITIFFRSQMEKSPGLLRIKLKKLTFCKNVIFSFILLTTSVYSYEVVESLDSVEDTNLKIIKLLNNLTEDRVEPLEKTRGFSYRYSPLWYSPLKFDFYIGKFSKKSQGALIRIEASRRGEEKIYKSILSKYLSLGEDENFKSLDIRKKNHLFTQTFNLVSPSLSIFYLGFNSPFYQTNEMLMKMGLYFLIDMVIIGLFALYAENTVKTKSVLDRFLLKEGPDGFDLMKGSNSGFFLAFLAVPRIIRAVDGFSETATQNKIHEFLGQKANLEIAYTVRY